MTQTLLHRSLAREHAPGTGLTPRETAERAATSASSLATSKAGSAIVMAVVTSFAELQALESDWQRLFEASARPTHVFQSFNWCWHWCRHYLDEARGGARLVVVTGRIDGRLALVMPLVAQRTAGLIELVWLGEPVSQYGDVLAAPEATSADVLEAAWQVAVRASDADVANLRRVRADAVAAPLLARLGAAVTATEEAPLLDLAGDDTFDGWEQRRQPRAKKNRRRQARRLAEMGEVICVSHAGTDRARDLTRLAVGLKRDMLGAKGAISVALAAPRFAAFFADAAAGAGGRPAGVVVKTLEVGGKVAAIKVLVDCKRWRFLHIAVYDAGYEKCGAGAVLFENVARRTIEQGYDALDLLPPRHDYKMDFADRVVLVHDHALALTAKGWLYTQGFLRMRRHLKAAVEALPLPVRQVLAKLAA